MKDNTPVYGAWNKPKKITDKTIRNTLNKAIKHLEKIRDNPKPIKPLRILPESVWFDDMCRKEGWIK